MTRGSADFTVGQATLISSQAAVSQSIGVAEANMEEAGLVGATTANAGIAGLAATIAASQQLAVLTTANGYLGRAVVNGANAST